MEDALLPSLHADPCTTRAWWHAQNRLGRSAPQRGRPAPRASAATIDQTATSTREPRPVAAA